MAVGYDIDALRNQTHKHAINRHARIPCPDCKDKPILDITEDNPVVAAMILYCPLCDGFGFVSKARALAVLPHISECIKKFQSKEIENDKHT